MSAFVQWLSETPISSAIRDIDWLIPTLQSVHILAIAMVLSSLFMIDLRILKATRYQTLSLADTMHRFEAWIWSGLIILAASGAPLIVAEPQRTLPNSTFQLKMLLLALAAATTYALRISLRRTAVVPQHVRKCQSRDHGACSRHLAFMVRGCRRGTVYCLYAAGLTDCCKRIREEITLENIAPLLHGLERTPLAVAIAELAWAFPIIETVHVIALTMTIGTVLVMDLRCSEWLRQSRITRHCGGMCYHGRG